MHRTSGDYPAFTLLELLVSIAIIALLAALVVPVFRRIQDSGDKAECVSNLRMLGIAQNLFASEHDNRMCAGTTVNPGNGYPFGSGQIWQVQLLPYLGEASGQVGPSRDEMDFVFNCPSVHHRTLDRLQTTYALSWVLPHEGRNWLGRLAMVDHPSRTVLMAETPPANTDYVRAVGQGTGFDAPAFRHGADDPGELETYESDAGYSYNGNGRANVLFVDGHVEGLLPGDMTHDPPDSIWWKH